MIRFHPSEQRQFAETIAARCSLMQLLFLVRVIIRGKAERGAGD